MTCPLCGDQSISGIALSDGNIVHDTCYKNATSSLNNLVIQTHNIKHNIQNLESKLKSSQGIIGSVVRMMFGGADPEIIRGELSRHNDLLTRVRNQHSEIEKSIKYIHDFMLTYPPDWRERTEEIRSTYHNCVECGSHLNLHTHHKIPLAKGGTNKLSNLVLLCEACHKEAHNVDSFSEKKSTLSTLDGRVKIINHSILSGLDIEFLYRKPSDERYSKRVITPDRLKRVAHESGDGFTLCVEGFCHKRQSQRIFALKRMKNLKQL